MANKRKQHYRVYALLGNAMRQVQKFLKDPERGVHSLTISREPCGGSGSTDRLIGWRVMWEEDWDDGDVCECRICKNHDA